MSPRFFRANRSGFDKKTIDSLLTNLKQQDIIILNSHWKPIDYNHCQSSLASSQPSSKGSLRSGKEFELAAEKDEEFDDEHEMQHCCMHGSQGNEEFLQCLSKAPEECEQNIVIEFSDWDGIVLAGSGNSDVLMGQPLGGNARDRASVRETSKDLSSFENSTEVHELGCNPYQYPESTNSLKDGGSLLCDRQLEGKLHTDCENLLTQQLHRGGRECSTHSNSSEASKVRDYSMTEQSSELIAIEQCKDLVDSLPSQLSSSPVISIHSLYNMQQSHVLGGSFHSDLFGIFEYGAHPASCKMTNFDASKQASLPSSPIPDGGRLSDNANEAQVPVEADKMRQFDTNHSILTELKLLNRICDDGFGLSRVNDDDSEVNIDLECDNAAHYDCEYSKPTKGLSLWHLNYATISEIKLVDNSCLLSEPIFQRPDDSNERSLSSSLSPSSVVSHLELTIPTRKKVPRRAGNVARRSQKDNNNISSLSNRNDEFTLAVWIDSNAERGPEEASAYFMSEHKKEEKQLHRLWFFQDVKSEFIVSPTMNLEKSLHDFFSSHTIVSEKFHTKFDPLKKMESKNKEIECNARILETSQPQLRCNPSSVILNESRLAPKMQPGSYTQPSNPCMKASADSDLHLEAKLKSATAGKTPDSHNNRKRLTNCNDIMLESDSMKTNACNNAKGFKNGSLTPVGGGSTNCKVELNEEFVRPLSCVQIDEVDVVSDSIKTKNISLMCAPDCSFQRQNSVQNESKLKARSRRHNTSGVADEERSYCPKSKRRRHSGPTSLVRDPSLIPSSLSLPQLESLDLDLQISLSSNNSEVGTTEDAKIIRSSVFSEISTNMSLSPKRLNETDYSQGCATPLKELPRIFGRWTRAHANLKYHCGCALPEEELVEMTIDVALR